ncbi:hypothetical protein GCM10023162_00520 [Klenkia terrae]
MPSISERICSCIWESDIMSDISVFIPSMNAGSFIIVPMSDPDPEVSESELANAAAGIPMMAPPTTTPAAKVTIDRLFMPVSFSMGGSPVR